MENKFNEVIEIFKEKTKKDCYKISLIEEIPSILDDKIGGKPYLPVGEKYPVDQSGEPLALLLQINLNKVDLDGYPKKGILEIFTDKDVNWPCQYTVKYFEEGLEYQSDLPNIDMSNYIVKKPFKIDLDKDISYMSTNDYRFIKTICQIINNIFNTNINNYSQLNKFFGDFQWYDRIQQNCGNPGITLGGYPDFTQDDPRYDMKENRDECLFKIDSFANYDAIEIGDSGILFVLISQKDIENCNFENAFVDYDCC